MPISLSLQINSPCQENWNSMEPTEHGKFCNTCQKAVVDLTAFTDQQILQYFLNNPIPACGRMLTTQKDHLYNNAIPNINRTLSPVAASLLTLAAITAEAAPPLKVNSAQAQMANTRVTPLPTDSIIISGTIKNKQGVPIEHVEIVFDHFKTQSDKEGNFRFLLSSDLHKPAILQFSYPSLKRETRNYHPLMGSTSYDITLVEPAPHCYEVMGLIAPSFKMPLPFSKLQFQPSNKLDSKNKAFLHDLAQIIKENPHIAVVIKPYYKSNKQRAVKMYNLIKDFFVNEEGIGEDRFLLTDPQLRKENTAEVIIEFTPKAY